MIFADVNFTRSTYTCKARAMYITGFNAETNMPTFDSVETEEFIAGKSNDTTLAYRLLKKLNKKVIKETVSITVVKEEVRSQSLEEFYNNSETVERAANGRVKK